MPCLVQTILINCVFRTDLSLGSQKVFDCYKKFSYTTLKYKWKFYKKILHSYEAHDQFTCTLLPIKQTIQLLVLFTTSLHKVNLTATSHKSLCLKLTKIFNEAERDPNKLPATEDSAKQTQIHIIQPTISCFSLFFWGWRSATWLPQLLAN